MIDHMSADWPVILALASVPVSNAAAWVIWRVYGPNLSPRFHEDDRAWLRHGIVAGFLGQALNTNFWAVKWLALLLGHAEFAQDWTWAGGFVDPVLKGAAPGWAAYAHLRARWLRLPSEIKDRHGVFGSIMSQECRRVFRIINRRP